MFFHNNITERRNFLDIGGGKKKKEKRKSLTEDTFGVSQEKTKRPIDGESVHSLTTRKHAF